MTASIQTYNLWKLHPSETESDTRNTWKFHSKITAKEEHQEPGIWLVTEGDETTPKGPGFLRTSDNPTHWLPFSFLGQRWHQVATIVVSDAPMPEDWIQPSKPYLADITGVWVHFTQNDGPYDRDHVINRFLAPRYPTPEIIRFLDGRLQDRDCNPTPTPSAASMYEDVLMYVSRERLVKYPEDILTPDTKLAELLGSSTPFPYDNLNKKLTPFYGPIAIPSI